MEELNSTGCQWARLNFVVVLINGLGSSSLIQTAKVAAKLAERRHVLRFVENAGFEPRTLGTGKEGAANCATRPGFPSISLGKLSWYWRPSKVVWVNLHGASFSIFLCSVLISADSYWFHNHMEYSIRRQGVIIWCSAQYLVLRRTNIVNFNTLCLIQNNSCIDSIIVNWQN